LSLPVQTIAAVRSVDDFQPDEGLDASFLDDLNETTKPSSHAANRQDNFTARYELWWADCVIYIPKKPMHVTTLNLNTRVTPTTVDSEVFFLSP
jgi:hypothetical protein